MKLIGSFLVIIGLAIFLFIYGPIAKEELQYLFDGWGGVSYSLNAHPDFPQVQIRQIVPKDKSFGIVIPKINLNAAIYRDVDPTNPKEYLPILRRGVAQSKGSVTPDKYGNVFLFAHSADAFYNVARYNALFFLIGKLEKGDEVDVFYRDKRYQYQVTEKAVVSSEYLEEYVKEKTQEGRMVTLQTCYPPGTTLKRLLVVAKMIEQSY